MCVIEVGWFLYEECSAGVRDQCKGGNVRSYIVVDEARVRRPGRC